MVIPAKLRRAYGIEEGAFVITEPREGGVLIRPAVALPVENYSDERKAEFLLTNAVDEQDWPAPPRLYPRLDGKVDCGSGDAGGGDDRGWGRGTG